MLKFAQIKVIIIIDKYTFGGVSFWMQITLVTIP